MVGDEGFGFFESPNSPDPLRRGHLSELYEASFKVKPFFSDVTMQPGPQLIL